MSNDLIKYSNKVDINSNNRISDYAEVFTDEREVNAMLDLVKHETENIDSRFLEPACGTGNFLVEVLKRKLKIVEKRYCKNQIEYDRYSIAAVCSIYGVELLPDNTKTCRDRLFSTYVHNYTLLFKKIKTELLNSVEFILNRNILCGNALTLKTSDDKEPITFSEWSFVKGSLVKRRDFIFEELIPKDKSDLFNKGVVSDEGKLVFIPKSIKVFQLTHFLNLANAV